MNAKLFLARLRMVVEGGLAAAVGVAIIVKIYKTAGQIDNFSEAWPSGFFFLLALWFLYSAVRSSLSLKGR